MDYEDFRESALAHNLTWAQNLQRQKLHSLHKLLDELTPDWVEKYEQLTSLVLLKKERGWLDKCTEIAVQMCEAQSLWPTPKELIAGKGL